MTDDHRNYSLKPTASPPIRSVELSHQPPVPGIGHRIGLIGCGGISESHLQAYRKAGFAVVAFSDLDRDKASARRDQFYPDAIVYDDYQSLLDQADVDVVDVATPADPRPPIIEAALHSGRHVLSQKPFVTDLTVGRRLVDLADRCGCRLAVNQNGRWAPHLASMRQAVKDGLLGDVVSVRVDIGWDHNWIAGTPFDEMRHVILQDFAIHWFDFLASVIPGVAESVVARVVRSPGQLAKPPLVASTVLSYPQTQAVLTFDGDCQRGAEDRTFIRGTAGTLCSVGPSLTEQTLTVHTRDGWFRPTLIGDWFSEGFIGTMAELLCAIEQDRQPLNNARDNLRGLAMCFAAAASADRTDVAS